jgi:hypothetical protein
MGCACDLFAVVVLDGIPKHDYSRSDAAPCVPTNRPRMPRMVIGVEVLEICEALRESTFETASRLSSYLPPRGVCPDGLNGLPNFDPVGRKA